MRSWPGGAGEAELLGDHGELPQLAQLHRPANWAWEAQPLSREKSDRGDVAARGRGWVRRTSRRWTRRCSTSCAT